MDREDGDLPVDGRGGDKERFYRHFSQAAADIQRNITLLAEAASADRRSAHDRILETISSLSTEAQDAADYLPTHDRRSYSETLKTLADQLRHTAATLAPRPRFQFKSRAAPAGGDPRLQPDRRLAPAAAEPHSQHAGSDRHSSSPMPLPAGKVTEQGRDYNGEVACSTDRVRRVSFSTATRVTLSGHRDIHVVVPRGAAGGGATSLTALSRCVVQLGGGGSGGLALRDIVETVVVVAAPVEGAVHATGLTRAVLVLSARQVRLHDCRDVTVYLRCSSRPVVEDCSGMRFAPLPAALAATVPVTVSADFWSQVEDFKWLRAEQSPNWAVLAVQDRMPEKVWQELLDPETRGTHTIDELLSNVGIRSVRGFSPTSVIDA